MTTTNPAGQPPQAEQTPGRAVPDTDRLHAMVHDPSPEEAAAATAAAANNPGLLGVPTFVVGSIALGLVLTGYVPATAAGASLAIILMATGIGQLISAVWAISLGQGPVACIFGAFSGFWLSYAVLVLGLTHNWFGIPPEAAVKTQGLFLISWLAVIIVLTLVTLRLPLAFTVLFVLVDIALALVLVGTLNASEAATNAGGYVVFAFALIGVYLFADAMGQATGGKALPMGTPVLH